MKFCFFGNISGALKGQTVGGAELQISLLAKALALRGHEVVIVDPYSNESFVTIEGVKLITLPKWQKGPRGIRLFTYRIPALWKIFIEQNADYYYVLTRSYLHLISYLAARKKRKKFIQGIASDLDVLSFKEKFKYEYKPNFSIFKFLTVSIPNDIVFKFLLEHSDYIVLQHSGQRFYSTKLKSKIVILQNPIDTKNIPIVENPSKDYFIHVGTLSVLKGMENLFHLIKILHESIRILIVGQPVDSRSKKILGKLNNVENVILKGRLNHSETLNLIANAKALINTSNYEGFPNIFIEAWASGVPVISLNVNPGDVFYKYNVGMYCEGSLEKMKECIECDKTADINKDDLLSYVSKFHDFNNAGERFLNILNT